MVSETRIVNRQPVWVGLMSWLKMAQTQTLLQFLGVLILAFAVASFYFWQANAIDDIHDSATRLTAQAQELERENALLITQVAAWNRPDVVATKAPLIGLGPGASPAYAQIATPGLQAQPAPRPNDLASWWQQLVRDVGQRWSGVTRTAELPASR